MHTVMVQKPTVFYLVRHGETQQNKEKIIQGHLDTDLNENGIQQAQKIAEVFADVWLDNVYSSDLKRAIQTAHHIVSPKNMEVKPHFNLREITLGDYEGKPIALFQKELQTSLEYRDSLPDEERFKHKVRPNIESDEELIKRFLHFFQETEAETTGKTNVVVTHGAAIRIFLVYLGWAHYAQLPHGNIENTAYAVIEKTHTGFLVKKTSGIIKSSV